MSLLEPQEIQFQRHALACGKMGLEAKLQAYEMADCPLELTEKNTVQGTCGGFTLGTTHQLRLVYFARLPPPAAPSELELAIALTFLDLSSFEGAEAVVSFDEISTYPDDDGDGTPNIAEWCANTNPRGD